MDHEFSSASPLGRCGIKSLIYWMRQKVTIPSFLLEESVDTPNLFFGAHCDVVEGPLVFVITPKAVGYRWQEKRRVLRQ